MYYISDIVLGSEDSTNEEEKVFFPQGCHSLGVRKTGKERYEQPERALINSVYLINSFHNQK